MDDLAADDIALDGYLRLNGRTRFIPGLDALMRDAQTLGAHVYFVVPPDRSDGVACIWSRNVLLHPRLFDAPCSRLKQVLAHELGHIAVGRASETKANRWVRRHYPDLWAAG